MEKSDKILLNVMICLLVIIITSTILQLYLVAFIGIASIFIIIYYTTTSLHNHYINKMLKGGK